MKTRFQDENPPLSFSGAAEAVAAGARDTEDEVFPQVSQIWLSGPKLPEAFDVLLQQQLEPQPLKSKVSWGLQLPHFGVHHRIVTVNVKVVTSDIRQIVVCTDFGYSSCVRG